MKPTTVRLIPLIAAILLPASMAAAGVVIDMPPAPAQPQQAELPDQATTQAEDVAASGQADVGSVALWRYANARTGPRNIWFPPVVPFGYTSDFVYSGGFAFSRWSGWPSVIWHGWWPHPLHFPWGRVPRLSWTLR